MIPKSANRWSGQRQEAQHSIRFLQSDSIDMDSIVDCSPFQKNRPAAVGLPGSFDAVRKTGMRHKEISSQTLVAPNTLC
jgi:hypothetical protein